MKRFTVFAWVLALLPPSATAQDAMSHVANACVVDAYAAVGDVFAIHAAPNADAPIIAAVPAGNAELSVDVIGSAGSWFAISHAWDIFEGKQAFDGVGWVRSADLGVDPEEGAVLYAERRADSAPLFTMPVETYDKRVERWPHATLLSCAGGDVFMDIDGVRGWLLGEEEHSYCGNPVTTCP